MPTRIKAEILAVDKKLRVETSVFLNSGFTGEEPHLLIPLKVAQCLGILPPVPETATVQDYELADGNVVRLYFIKNAVKLRVLVNDRQTEYIVCSLVISQRECEVILNDAGIDALNIIIERYREGLWRFRDETKTRASTGPKYWCEDKT
jgi:hypothetical protein